MKFVNSAQAVCPTSGRHAIKIAALIDSNSCARAGAIIATCISIGMTVDEIETFYLESGETMFSKAGLLKRAEVGPFTPAASLSSLQLVLIVVAVLVAALPIALHLIGRRPALRVPFAAIAPMIVVWGGQLGWEPCLAEMNLLARKRQDYYFVRARLLEMQRLPQS